MADITARPPMQTPSEIPETASHEGPRSSIRTRLLLLAVGLTLAALAVVIVTAFTLSRNIIGQAQQVSSESLQKQAETYLVQINNSIAGQSALVLDRAARDIKSLADTATMVYGGHVDLPEKIISMSVGPEGQRMNGPEAVSSVFVPNTTWQASSYDPALNAAVQNDIELTAYLDLTLPALKNNNPNASAIYMGTQHNVLRYYPNIEIGKVVPADFSVTQRPWYISSLDGNSDPGNLKPVWSEVYFDATGLGLVTTVAMPVYTGDILVGVVGLDVTLEQIRRNIEDTRFLASGYSFLIDEDGNAIILPEQSYEDLFGAAPDPNQQTPNLIELANASKNINPQLGATLNRMTAGEQDFVRLQLGEREYYVAFAPVTTGATTEITIPGWSLATVVASEEVLSSVAGLQSELNRATQQVLLTRILPAGIVLAILVVVAAGWGVNRLVSPLLQLSTSAEQLGAGDWEAPLPMLQTIEAQNNDEIGLLAHTMETMAGQLRQTIGGLEQRVSERTQALEYRTNQLQTAAEAAREISAAQDLDTLLNGAVNLISERFGYYHVGIFLVDETSEYAHLRAASGELGKRLVERDIRLRVGAQGLVGYVTRFGVARRSQDVGQDRLYWAEPLLSDTAAEATLPLRSEGKIIGALDVQIAHRSSGDTDLSVQTSARLNDDDLVTLQTLADQLATAIENVRLLEQLKSTLAETDRLFSEQARDAWRKMHAVAESSVIATGAQYDRLEVRRLTEERLKTLQAGAAPAARAAAASPGVLRVPVTLRGQVIGYIGLENDDPLHVWSADEVAIVEATAAQAAQSVENARLLAESQRRATQEKISAEIGARLQASLEPQQVLESAVQEIALQLGIAEVSVELLPEARQLGDTVEGLAAAYLSATAENDDRNGDPGTTTSENYHERGANGNRNDDSADEADVVTAGGSKGGVHESA